MQMLHRFLKDEAGATAIEYGLIAAFMAVIVIAAFNFLNPALQGTFEDIAGTLEDPSSALPAE